MNKTLLLGRLGRDPEFFDGQTPRVRLSVATSERRKIGEAWEEHTEWHTVVAFGRLAENCAKFLAKGRQVLVEGKISTHSYTAEGETKPRYSTSIIAQSVEFIGSAEKGDGYTKKIGDTIKESLHTADYSSTLTDSGQGSPWSDDDEIPF